MSGQEEEQLTLFPEGFRASPSVWPESREGKKTSGTCGPKCSGLSGSCARIASSVRTYLESSALPPGRWSRIWSRQVITSSCSILKLRLSELGTDDQGSFSLLPTPNTMDKLPPKSPEALDREATGTRIGRKQPCNLRDWVAVKEGIRMWPTPTARDSKGANSLKAALNAMERDFRTAAGGWDECEFCAHCCIDEKPEYRPDEKYLEYCNQCVDGSCFEWRGVMPGSTKNGEISES